MGEEHPVFGSLGLTVWKGQRLPSLRDGAVFCLEQRWRATVVNVLFLTCHSSVLPEGAEEGSGLVQVTTQRLQRTSPPLGGHFCIHLSNTEIPGKGATWGCEACLIDAFSRSPGK